MARIEEKFLYKPGDGDPRCMHNEKSFCGSDETITSKEALKQIMKKYTFYVPARSGGKEHLINCLNIVVKDLERLEKLEEENQDLKNRLDNEQLAFDKLFESNQKLSELYAKLKKSIKLFLKYYRVYLYDEDGLGSCEIGVDTIGEEFYISKEEYLLLKEVFGNES